MKDKKKVVMLFSIAAIVVVGVGAGFWAWHEQPGFCSTMCHNTMGSYLETYEQSNFLVHEHAQVDVACLDCHEAEGTVKNLSQINPYLDLPSVLWRLSSG